jgi:hypothetical protein
MGVHNLIKIHGLHMQDDFHQYIDYQFPQLGEKFAVQYAEGMTAENDASDVEQFPFSLLQLSKTEERMDLANLPTFADGFRIAVITPVQWRQLKHDPEYQRQGRYFPEYNILYGKSYLGSVGKFHLFESNTLLKPANGNTTVLAGGVPVQHGMAFAPGVFMGGMGEKPRVAPPHGRQLWRAGQGYLARISRVCSRGRKLRRVSPLRLIDNRTRKQWRLGKITSPHRAT